MSNWTVPTANDVESTFASLFAEQDANDFDATALAGAWMPIIVAMFRGNILRGNRSGLSKTAGSVPPEAKVHVLVLVAEAIIVNSPRLVGYIVLEGENGPMARMIIAARQFLKDCLAGIEVTAPTDLDPDTAPSGTQWGDDNGPGSHASVITDLTVDGPPL